MLKTVIQVPIDQELLDRIDQVAKAEHVSRAALIRTACLAHLRQLQREKWEREYEEGYRRVPEVVSEAEAAAWLAGSTLISEEWPEAPGQRE